MSRAVVISFFVFAVSFGMILTDSVNAQWKRDYGGNVLGVGPSPYMNYSDMLVAQDKGGYNSTAADIMSFNKPENMDFSAYITQNVKYSSILWGMLFNATYGFPAFMTNFGMPGIFVAPLTIFLVVNHVLALIYMVTGRTFVY